MTTPATKRLRPTNSFAAEALIVGDPGRALLLAQELIEEPKMCNHARGLWGYSGRSAVGGGELTIQSTGMGGPSAAMVLTDLAALGVERLVRVGSCAAAERAGESIAVERAVATAGSSAAFGVEAGTSVEPDPGLTATLVRQLGPDAHRGAVASFDAPPHLDDLPSGVDAADMQTVAVLARARFLGLTAAAVLVVVEGEGGSTLDDQSRDTAVSSAGRAAAAAVASLDLPSV